MGAAAVTGGAGGAGAQAAGVACGLMAALCQSLSYLATRHFVQRRPEEGRGGGTGGGGGGRAGASRMLLVLSHVWMGAWSAAALPFIWPAGGIPQTAWWGQTGRDGVLWPLVGTTIFYLLGQFGLMIALKRTEPSRVSPLLGFKIVILAVMTTALASPSTAAGGGAGGGGGLTALQWAGVGLCVIAAVGLNYAGGRLPGSAVAAVLFACVAYSLSDWHIGLLVAAIKSRMNLPDWQVTVLGTGLTYALAGALATAFLPFLGSRKWSDWRGAAPFGAAWLVAMLFLYGSFGLTGVVFGNILQSTRGLMSVGLASLAASRGLIHLEPETGRGVFWRRAAGAAVMFAAVVLYMLGKR